MRVSLASTLEGMEPTLQTMKEVCCKPGGRRAMADLVKEKAGRLPPDVGLSKFRNPETDARSATAQGSGRCSIWFHRLDQPWAITGLVGQRGLVARAGERRELYRTVFNVEPSCPGRHDGKPAGLPSSKEQTYPADKAIRRFQDVVQDLRGMYAVSSPSCNRRAEAQN